MKKRYPRKRRFILLTTGALLFIGLMLAVTVALVGKQISWNQFKNDFAVSIAYAMEGDCLKAEQDDAVVRVCSKNADFFYFRIVLAGYAWPYTPERTGESIYLDFGDGSRMQVDCLSDGRSAISYTSKSGKTRKFSLQEHAAYERLSIYLSLSGGSYANEAW